MIEFTHIVKDPNGLHARPAGLLVQKASLYSSEITIHNGERSTSAKRLISLLSLAVKQGSEIRVTVSGDDEVKAAKELAHYMKENL